ncbi:formylglycine-generating enzyme family protein [Citricoccus sp. NPDC079358]|jgi:formylglycine-generating enzyme required for sulfatase activity|uniref:formylglycine-generating enzyme family protein n=1 Tax=Citricoccus sp. NPDC079358 TaxID=3154653 RepID=UPI00344CE673
MIDTSQPGHDVVHLDGGTFTMGSDDHYPEEAPKHPVTVAAFSIDRHPVTNRQFAAFVEKTGYRTVAQRPLDPKDFPGLSRAQLVPGSMVFTPTSGPVDLRHLSQWWEWKPGASWARPEGLPSTVADRGDHPVVHVCHEDAQAYAAWVGARLPTEAEWEFAARGGLDGAVFTWGDEARPGGRVMANSWDGLDFPWRSTGESGYERTSPVGSFPANGFGLHDMAGNVWEWTEDWWSARHPDAAASACCVPRDPRGGSVEDSFDPAQPQFRMPRKVIKGGSHLCADTYCLRYRPAARRPQMIDTGMSHVGFRCAWSRPSDEEQT